MKKGVIISLFATLVILVFLGGCASLLDDMVDGLESSPPAPKAVSSDPLDGYVMAYKENTGSYSVAKIVKPASAETKNQAEILDMQHNGKKRWAKVFTSHPAAKSELSVGEIVLTQDSGFSDPDKDTLIATSWTAYYITDTSDLFKGEIKVGSLVVPIKHLRIPDTEIPTR